MRLVECTKIPKIKGTVVVTHDHGKLQISHDEIGLLDEYTFPVLFWDSDPYEDVSFYIDDVILNLFESHKFVKVFENHLDFDDFTYLFTKSSDMIFETELPPIYFICVFPDFKNIDQTVTVSDSALAFENGLTYNIIPIWRDVMSNQIEITINGSFIEPGICKVRMQEGSLVCFDYGIKKRFVAPIVEE